jgi:type III pantothenate kinase
VSEDGKVLGVSIAPGLRTAVKALFSNTAQLPEVPLELPHSVLGKNSVHAIQSGILWGYEGLVKNMIHKIRAELGGDCIAIATGGLSSIISTLNGEFVEVNRELTLEGLRIIGEEN